jgi:hypothetical protein
MPRSLERHDSIDGYEARIVRLRFRVEEQMIPERWAWEFLRRSPDSRQDWAQALASASAFEVMRRERLTQDDPHLYIPLGESREKWGLVAYCNPSTPRTTR